MGDTDAKGGVLAARALRALSAVYVLSVLVFAVHCTYAAWRDHFTVPYVDDWRILNDMFSQPLSAWILTDQIGHRIPVTLLLIFLDYTFFAGRMYVVTFAALVCLWLTAVALHVGLRPDAGPRAPVDHVRFGFCVFCLFWAAAFFDLSWATNQGTQLCVLWLVVALAALAAHQRRRNARSAAGGRSLPFVAGLAAFAATFSHGVGAASWAAVNSVALIARLPQRTVIALAGGALVSVTLYGSDLSVPQSSLRAYRNRLIRMPGRVADFVTAFVGAPLAYVVGGLGGIENENILATATVAGRVAVAALALGAVVAFVRRSPPRAEQLVPAGLMALSVAGGCIVAINRLPFPSTAISDRFLSWSTPFWAGAASVLVLLGGRSPAAGWGALLLAASLSVAMLPALGQARLRQRDTAYRLDVEAAMHQVDVRWSGMRRLLTKPELVDPVIERMRRDRRGVFADPRAALRGAPFARRFALASSPCEASVARAEWLDPREGRAAMLRGFVWGREGPRAEYVVVTDANGVLCGLGAVARDPVSKPVGGVPPGATPTEWSAFLNASEHPAPYGLHLVLPGERHVCRIATWAGGP